MTIYHENETRPALRLQAGAVAGVTALAVRLAERLLEVRRQRDLPDLLRRDVGLPPVERWHDRWTRQ